MPITLQEIKEHQNQYGTQDIGSMTTSDYRKVLAEEGFFWGDPHGFIMHQLSKELIVTNTEQLDALLEHLETYRHLLPRTPAILSEK